MASVSLPDDNASYEMASSNAYTIDLHTSTSTDKSSTYLKPSITYLSVGEVADAHSTDSPTFTSSSRRRDIANSSLSEINAKLTSNSVPSSTATSGEVDHGVSHTEHLTNMHQYETKKHYERTLIAAGDAQTSFSTWSSTSNVGPWSASMFPDPKNSTDGSQHVSDDFRSTIHQYSERQTRNIHDGYIDPDFIDDLQYKVYNIIIPLVICLGVLANVLCIVVLTKPKMRSVHVNKYFLALAISDLMVCVLNIPIASTTNGCSIRSYATAFYYAHFGWSLIDVWQTLSFYTILFLSFDRFLAVWFYQYFKKVQTVNVIFFRAIVVVIVDLTVHLFFFINVSIECKDSAVTCPNDIYIIEDGYRKNNGETWHIVLMVFHEIMIRWIPGILLIIFNVGLVTAITSGRLNNPASSLRKKNRKEFRVTITSVVITVSFIICTFPNAIFVVGFSEHVQTKCFGKYEIIRGVANILQLLEHVIHIAFLALLIPSFRYELLSLLSCKPTPDIHSDDNQSSKNLQMYQVNRRSGQSPFPSRSNDACANNTQNLNIPNNANGTNSLGLAPPPLRY